MLEVEVFKRSFQKHLKMGGGGRGIGQRQKFFVWGGDFEGVTNPGPWKILIIHHLVYYRGNTFIEQRPNKFSKK